jgi:hypothetical protein
MRNRCSDSINSEKNPNASLGTIAEIWSISPETGLTRMSRIGYALKILRWIRYALTNELKQVRVTMCLQLPPKEVKQRKTEKEERKHKTKIIEEIPGQR